MNLEIAMEKRNKNQRLLVMGWICSHMCLCSDMCLRTKDGSIFHVLSSVLIYFDFQSIEFYAFPLLIS